jgi:hypothetical protein
MAVVKWRQSFPSLKRRAGAKRRGGQSGEIFRPKNIADLTTPSAALWWLRNFSLMPQPPLLFKEGK